jgi:hypothetical protein
VVDGTPAAVRLGVIESSTPGWWSGPYPMIALYAALALTVAVAARRLGATPVRVALAGLAGPAVVASAYLIATLGGGDPTPALTASLAAAVLGLIAGAAVALIGPRRPTTAAAVPTSPAVVPVPRAAPAAPAVRPEPAATATLAKWPGGQDAPTTTTTPTGSGRGDAARAEDKPLRRREQEHVKWMQNLRDTPPDPELTPRRRATSG